MVVAVNVVVFLIVVAVIRFVFAAVPVVRFDVVVVLSLFFCFCS